MNWSVKRIWTICKSMNKKKKGAAAIVMVAAVTFATGIFYTREVKTTETAQTTSEKQTTEERAEETVSAKKIGICIYRYDDDFMKLITKELKNSFIENYGIEANDIFTFYAEEDLEKQQEQVEKLMERGVCGLIIQAVEEAKIPALADQCAEKQIPVVFINSEPAEEEKQRWSEEKIAASWVGTDGRQAGAYQGQLILESPEHGDFNGDGMVSYVMIQGDLDAEDTKNRTEYSVKTLTDQGIRVQKLTEVSGNWEESRGKELTEQALKRYGRRVEVIICNNDAMANGASEAIQEAGRVVGKDICLVGVDGLRSTVTAVRDGNVTGTVLNDYHGQAKKAAEVLMKLVDGEHVETEYLIDHVKISGNGQ